jgi:hypothetical protein
MHLLTIFSIFIDLQSQWNFFYSRKMENIQSLDAFWLKYWPLSLWHISKLSILCFFPTLFATICLLKVTMKLLVIKRIQILKAGIHFDWNIDFLFSTFVSLWRFWQIILYRRKTNVSQVKSVIPFDKFIELKNKVILK